MHYSKSVAEGKVIGADRTVYRGLVPVQYNIIQYQGGEASAPNRRC